MKCSSELTRKGRVGRVQDEGWEMGQKAFPRPAALSSVGNGCTGLKETKKPYS